MKRKCFLYAASLLLSICTPADLFFISAYAGETAEQKTADYGRNLEWTITGSRIEKETDSLCSITLDYELVNWSLDEISLSKNLSAKLVYKDIYEYPGVIHFSLGETQIEMLETVEGDICFILPEQAAVNMPDLTLQIIHDGNIYSEKPDYASSLEKLLTEYPELGSSEESVPGKLQLILKDSCFLDFWMGEEDPKYKWLIQEFELINGLPEGISLSDILTATITFRDLYPFDAQISLPETIIPLQTVTGKIIVRVPTLVSKAEKGELACHLGLNPKEHDISSDRFDFPESFIISPGANPPSPFSGISVGDLIKFGRYEQDGNSENGPEAIEWQVLSVEDDRAFIVSEWILDTVPYHKEAVDITWEKCTLRKWLNSDFLNTAFTEKEQELILLTHVVNDDNPKYRTKGGKDTEDKLFLLSLDEAQEYFADDESRICHPTQYAKENGARISDSSSGPSWWLRSPGMDRVWSACVYSDGWIYSNNVTSGITGIRPALFVDLTGDLHEINTANDIKQAERTYETVSSAITEASGGEIKSNSYLFSDFTGDGNAEGIAVVNNDGFSTIWLNNSAGETKAAATLPIMADDATATTIARGASNNYGVTIYNNGTPYSAVFSTDGSNLYTLIELLQGQITIVDNYNIRIGYAGFHQDGDSYSEYAASNISLDQLLKMPGGAEAWEAAKGIMGTDAPPELFIQNRRTAIGNRLEFVYQDNEGSFHTFFMNWDESWINYNGDYVDEKIPLSYTSLNKIYPNTVPKKQTEAAPVEGDPAGTVPSEGVPSAQTLEGEASAPAQIVLALTDADRSAKVNADGRYTVSEQGARDLNFTVTTENISKSTNKTLALNIAGTPVGVEPAASYTLTVCDLNTTDSTLDLILQAKDKSGKTTALNVYHNATQITQLGWVSIMDEWNAEPKWISEISFPNGENGQVGNGFHLVVEAPLRLDNLGPYAIETEYACTADAIGACQLSEKKNQLNAWSYAWKLTGDVTTTEYTLAADTVLLTDTISTAAPGATLPAGTRVYPYYVVKAYEGDSPAWYVSVTDEAGNYGYLPLNRQQFSGIGG